ncbi:MAG: phosphatase PAP2 family protein [Pyrinomonadaceae bacterium]
MANVIAEGMRGYTYSPEFARCFAGLGRFVPGSFALNTNGSNYFTGISLIAILFFALVSARAQTASPTPSPAASPAPKSSLPPTLEHEFFKNILRDQKAIWTAPLHLHADDARWLAPLGVGTAALIATDRQTADAIGEFHDQLKPSRVISYAGSTYGLGAVAASFYLIGRAKNNNRARETGLLSAEALVNSLIVVTALKGITQRARPLSGRERSKFFVGGTSFPSGHSIQAWSVATVVAHEYHDRVAVQIAAYGIAGAVSVARFTGRRHYLSDVLVGSVMGYGIGRYVYRARHRKNSDSGGEGEKASYSGSKRWPVIATQYDRRAREYGLVLAWSF